MSPGEAVLPQHHFFLQSSPRLLRFLSDPVRNRFHLTNQLDKIRLCDGERLRVREHGLVLVGPEDLRGASRFGPNGLKLEKETTHVIVRWTRVVSMA